MKRHIPVGVVLLLCVVVLAATMGMTDRATGVGTAATMSAGCGGGACEPAPEPTALPVSLELQTADADGSPPACGEGGCDEVAARDCAKGADCDKDGKCRSCNGGSCH